MSFTPLLTYKVLKHEELNAKTDCSFTPLLTYKVLKQVRVRNQNPEEFYTPLNLQGSQTVSSGWLWLFPVLHPS